MNNLYEASQQYASRPKDERFDSIEGLLANAQHNKAHSYETTYNLKDLLVVGTPEGIHIQSPKGTATPTHWSFGQLSRMLGAPGAFLRDGLSPQLAADVLNYRIDQSAPGSTASLLIKKNGGDPVVRSVNSESYGRLWEYDLISNLNETILKRDPSWGLPPVWGGGVAGAYSGDRDSFLIVTNGGSIVNDPSTGSKDGTMFRGILVRNSEVGAAAVTIDSVLFRYICGNHIIWGGVYDSRFRRRHIGSHVLRDVVRQIGTIAFQWANSSTERDNAIIKGLIEHELAFSKEAVVDELQKMGASKGDAILAYETCEKNEEVSPRSYWGLAQGLTRASQEQDYQNERYEWDKLASQVMARGAKLVRV